TAAPGAAPTRPRAPAERSAAGAANRHAPTRGHPTPTALPMLCRTSAVRTCTQTRRGGGGCIVGMKRYAPLITLLAGLILAGVLVTASTIAARPAAGPDPSASEPAEPLAQPSAAQSSAAAEPSPSPARAAAKVNAVWAGEVDGGGATIAISVKDGVAIAYLCDGRRIEAWL